MVGPNPSQKLTMNAIGRVFLVLNLGLAGTFVGMSGTYLERASDWKDKFQKRDAEAQREAGDLKTSLSAEKEKYNNSQHSNNGLTVQIAGLKNQLKDKEDTNVRLQARLATMEAAAKKTESYMSRVDTRINAAFTNMDAAQKMAIQAEKDKDAAIAAKNTADKLLAEANFKIKNQGDDIANKVSLISKHEGTIKEKNILLDIVNRRYPGIFTTLHPLVTGIVSHVSASGKLITIDLKTGGDSLKGGHTFAIFSAAQGYKGEAVVTEIDEGKKFCFARLSLDEGKKIAAGDSASTDVSRAGN